jgi:hypothetical protein
MPANFRNSETIVRTGGSLRQASRLDEKSAFDILPPLRGSIVRAAAF